MFWLFWIACTLTCVNLFGFYATNRGKYLAAAVITYVAAVLAGVML